VILKVFLLFWLLSFFFNSIFLLLLTPADRGAQERIAFRVLEYIIDAVGDPVPPTKKKIAYNFASLGLSQPLLRTIEDIGYIEPTPIQISAIPLIMMGKDVIGVI
jgi:hypothetical protein